MQVLWRLEELVQRGQRAMALLSPIEGASRRVCWRPDARLVRYYTTLGLLDRPAELRGRTAYYSDRHLLQLLMIKTLQVRGFSLHAIQREMGGQSDAALRRYLGLPEDWTAQLSASNQDANRIAPPRMRSTAISRITRFWEQPAALPTPPPAASECAAPSATELTVMTPTALLALHVAPGAQLLLERDRYPEIDHTLLVALDALRQALLAAQTPQSPIDGDEPA